MTACSRSEIPDRLLATVDDPRGYPIYFTGAFGAARINVTKLARGLLDGSIPFERDTISPEKWMKVTDVEPGDTLETFKKRRESPTSVNLLAPNTRIENIEYICEHPELLDFPLLMLVCQGKDKDERPYPILCDGNHRLTSGLLLGRQELPIFAVWDRQAMELFAEFMPGFWKGLGGDPLRRIRKPKRIKQAA